MNFPELRQQLLRPLDGPLGDAREKQVVQREIPEMLFGQDVFPFDLDVVTEHREHQVRQSQLSFKC